VRDCFVTHVSKITSKITDNKDYIISNNRVDFRACYGSLEMDPKGGANLSTPVAKALHIDVGEHIRFISVNHKN
jgi:arginine N-succinyltransferase